jgi:DGQHR domain-containing protein
METKGGKVMSDQFPGIQLQSNPTILLTVIPGRWLLDHSTPSWRAEDPIKGFQRMVKEGRAQAIAAAVLDQQRSFPNAIVLATDSTRITCDGCIVTIPNRVVFLVVDGQHRLWSQQYSPFDAPYACTIHVGLTPERMAELFLEINDNQKRVPSSLRWDLVRLVQPEDDQPAVRSADLIYELSTDKDSPLFLRVDLTGENPEISLKQGSLAPEVKRLVVLKDSPLRDAPYEAQYRLLLAYFNAIRDRDPDGWRSTRGPLYKARVIRGLLRNLPALVRAIGKATDLIRARDFQAALRRLDLDSLSDDALRAAHGNAGIAQITQTIASQVIDI